MYMRPGDDEVAHVSGGFLDILHHHIRLVPRRTRRRC